MRTYARQKVVREAREKGIEKREKNAPKRRKNGVLEESCALQKCLQFLTYRQLNIRNPAQFLQSHDHLCIV
jgi:hypothetical protein